MKTSIKKKIAVVTVALGAMIAAFVANVNHAENKALVAKIEDSISIGEDVVFGIPDIVEKWDVTLITKPNMSDDDAAVMSWFEHNRHLKKLTETANFHHYKTNASIYKSRFRKYYGEQTPIVVLQTNQGQVVFKISADTFPSTADRLAYRIDDAIKGQCPDGKCPPRRPLFPPLVPDQIDIDHNVKIPDLGIDSGINSLTDSLYRWRYVLLLIGGAILWYTVKEDE